MRRHVALLTRAQTQTPATALSLPPTRTVPFAVSRDQALDKFSNATVGGTKASFLLSRLLGGPKPTDVVARPVFLPFLGFGGWARTKCDARIGYRRTTTTTDSKGRTRTHTTTDWYEKRGLNVGPWALDAENDACMSYYAGYEYRRAYVHAAMRPLGPVRATAVPFRALGDLSVASAGVQPFVSKPAFAYARVRDELHDLAHARTKAYVCSCDAAFEAHGALWALSGVFPTAGDWNKRFNTRVPGRYWKSPDRVELRNFEVTVDDKGLDHACLLPAWVVEYRWGGKPFRAFVNGVTAKVGCLDHVAAGPAAAAYGAGGALAGAAWLFFAKSAALVWAPLVLGGVGVLAGVQHARSKTKKWAHAAQQREENERANAEFRKSTFWQTEFYAAQQDAWEEAAEWLRTSEAADEDSSTSSVKDWRAMNDRQVLGIPPPAASRGGLSGELVSEAFRAQAMRWHPDHNRHLEDEERKECSERFKRVAEAYRRLKRGL